MKKVVALFSLLALIVTAQPALFAAEVAAQAYGEARYSEGIYLTNDPDKQPAPTGETPATGGGSSGSSITGSGSDVTQVDDGDENSEDTSDVEDELLPIAAPTDEGGAEQSVENDDSGSLLRWMSIGALVAAALAFVVLLTARSRKAE